MRTTACLFLLLLGTAVPMLAGCNTIAGVGEDMEAAGGAIEDAAEDNKSY